MKLAASTSDFYKYCQSHAECVENLHKAGFRYINFDIEKFETFQEDLLSDDWRKNLQPVLDRIESLSMKVIQTHAFSASNMLREGADKALVERKIHRSIEVTGALGATNMVLHAQLHPDFSKEQFFEYNRDFLKSLQPLCEQNGVHILIENGPLKHFSENFFRKEKVENPRTVWGFHNAKIMKEFLEFASLPHVFACWDTGHRNMDGTQYDELITLGEKLHALHVHDNRNGNDEHLAPYFGTMNWDDLMQGLIDCGYEGFFTFETTNGIGCESRYCKPRREFAADTRLQMPPLSLKLLMEKYIYEAGKHILESYGVFENE